jgi:N-hydroxyarylamine O-acetyltransferase
MTNLNLLFHNRINFPSNLEITFENINNILEQTAQNIPFENLCIISNNITAISKENLITKILSNNEGGICYELNYILYLFLLENGFDAKLVQGVIFNSATQEWSPTGKTHLAIIIIHNGKEYLIDSGFGGNLPLVPVPLSGEIASSRNGDFRIERAEDVLGNYYFYMKLNYKDTEWKLGYCFDSITPVNDETELNKMQKIIIEHPASPFNKSTLITRLTDKGSITLTDSTFTEWSDGKLVKTDIDKIKFDEIKRSILSQKV